MRQMRQTCKTTCIRMCVHLCAKWQGLSSSCGRSPLTSPGARCGCACGSVAIRRQASTLLPPTTPRSTPRKSGRAVGEMRLVTTALHNAKHPHKSNGNEQKSTSRSTEAKTQTHVPPEPTHTHVDMRVVTFCRRAPASGFLPRFTLWLPAYIRSEARRDHRHVLGMSGGRCLQDADSGGGRVHGQPQVPSHQHAPENPRLGIGQSSIFVRETVGVSSGRLSRNRHGGG